MAVTVAFPLQLSFALVVEVVAVRFDGSGANGYDLLERDEL